MERVLALLYDMHGNLPALEAVLADADDADEFLLGGDYATAGAWPRETVERLQGARERHLDPRQRRPLAGGPPRRARRRSTTIAARTAELLGDELVGGAGRAARVDRRAATRSTATPRRARTWRASAPSRGPPTPSCSTGVDGAARRVRPHPRRSSSATGPRGIELRQPRQRRHAAGTATTAPPTRVLDDDRVELRRVEYDWQAAVAAVRERVGELPGAPHGAGPVRRGLSATVRPRCASSNVLAPRDREFFDLFEEAGGNILRAAGLLEELLREYPERNELAREILICEQEGDRITHDIIQRLNQTFVTPIDREDIYELASALDDVVDYTEEVADYLGLYKIEAPMEQAQDLARVLHAAARQIAEAMPRLRGFKRHLALHGRDQPARERRRPDRRARRSPRCSTTASTRWS